MPRTQQWSFKWSASPQAAAAFERLCHFVRLSFRPIRVCATGEKEESDIDRVSQAFQCCLGKRYFDAPARDDAEASSKLVEAIRDLNRVELLDFRPIDYLVGHGIGPSANERWVNVIRSSVFPRALVERRIEKVRSTFGTDQENTLEDDYADGCTLDRDPFTAGELARFLDAEIVWGEKHGRRCLRSLEPRLRGMYRAGRATWNRACKSTSQPVEVSARG